MKIGFIGLGAMGRPMAFNLLKGGYALAVYARRPEAAQPLVQAGAQFCSTPAALASECDTVFTMVTATADVEQVLLGKDSVIEGARPGTVVVDCSTIDPAACRMIADRLAEKGIELLDAPVSGGPAGAEAGTLAIMVGGKEEVFVRMKPLLECLGKTIRRLGGPGAGQTAKACSQLALLVATEGVAEALALAEGCGVNPGAVREILLGGLAASRVMELFGARMVERDFSAGIETRLYHKDLAIVLKLARQVGQGIPAASLVMQHINALMSRGANKKDLSSLIQVIEELGGRQSIEHRKNA